MQHMLCKSNTLTVHRTAPHCNATHWIWCERNFSQLTSVFIIHLFWKTHRYCTDWMPFPSPSQQRQSTWIAQSTDSKQWKITCRPLPFYNILGHCSMYAGSPVPELSFPTTYMKHKYEVVITDPLKGDWRWCSLAAMTCLYCSVNIQWDGMKTLLNPPPLLTVHSSVHRHGNSNLVKLYICVYL